MNKSKLLNFLLCASVILLLARQGFVNCNTGIITSVNYAFETFSPYALIRFFEFSDKEWNITEKCFRDMYMYVGGLRNGEYWAVKCVCDFCQARKKVLIIFVVLCMSIIRQVVYDATSYYAGAAFSGTTVRLHNPNVCRSLSKQFHNNNKIPGDYLDATQLFVLPFDVHLISAHFLMEIAHDNYFRFEKIQQMICFPKSCKNVDLESILEVYLFQTTIFVRNVTYLRHRIITDSYIIYEDFNFYIIITILCGSMLIHMTVYIAKHYVVELNRTSLSNQRENQSNAVNSLKLDKLMNMADWKNTLESVDMKQFTMKCFQTTETENLPNTIHKQPSYCFEELLESVSLPNVIYNLLQTSSTPLCGMMFIFSLFFVWLHLEAEYSFMANNMDFGLANNKVKQRDALLKRSAYAMDVYFLINGAILSYDFFKVLPKDKLNVFEQLKHVAKLIFQKLVCILPSYTFLLYAAQLLDKCLHHNVALEIPSRDYKNCPLKMFSNIFYMDTYFPTTDRCMPWTWFISLQMQFCVTSCLLMLLVVIQFRYSMIIGTTIFCLSIVAATLWSLGPIYEYGYTTTLLYELVNFNLVLDNICLFIIPHLLGLCLGYIIFKMNYNFNISIYFTVLGWLLSLTLIGLYIFGFNLIFLHVNKLSKALLIITTHISWCCILIWTTLSALSNHGDIIYKILSFKYAQVFEKFTPINLILAPIIIRLVVFTADVPVYWSTGQTLAVFVGCLLMINTSSLLLYILLDGPLMAALEYLFHNN